MPKLSRFILWREVNFQQNFFDVQLIPYSTEYPFMDTVVGNKKTRLNAPQYIDAAMSWIGAQLDNEYLFPVKPGKATDPLIDYLVTSQY